MSFKDYILNVHPDPDFLGSKTVYDAYDELDRLAQNYAKDQNERLTKEVEELRLKVEKWVFSGVALHAKNTRLRELLRRSIPVLDRKNRYYTNLLADIDNKLKP